MKLNLRLKIGITIFLVITFLLILNKTSLSKEIKNFFYLISEPIQRALWRGGIKVSKFLETIFEIKYLKKENEELKLKILDLLSENIKKDELEKENIVLREALGLGLEKEFKLQLAQVIEKDIAQDFILINKGAKDGVLKDLPVITGQKVLIGRISEVYKNFSKVMLISNIESSLAVKVYEKEIDGVVKGGGEFKLSLEDIPKEKEIEKGNLVVTSILSKTYPQGLLVGQIEAVQKKDIEPYQTAAVKAAFDISEIEKLFIIYDF